MCDDVICPLCGFVAVAVVVVDIAINMPSVADQPASHAPTPALAATGSTRERCRSGTPAVPSPRRARPVSRPFAFPCGCMAMSQRSAIFFGQRWGVRARGQAPGPVRPMARRWTDAPAAEEKRRKRLPGGDGLGTGRERGAVGPYDQRVDGQLSPRVLTQAGKWPSHSWRPSASGSVTAAITRRACRRTCRAEGRHCPDCPSRTGGRGD